MDGTRLRPATEADRDFFFETRRAGFRDYVDGLGGWDDAAQREQADREFDELPVQIVERGGTAIGYLCVLDRPDHVWLDEIVLVPSAQGCGTGTALVQQLVVDAEARGLPVRLGVLVNNPARRLYERLGFRVVDAQHPRLRMQRR